MGESRVARGEMPEKRSGRVPRPVEGAGKGKSGQVCKCVVPAVASHEAAPEPVQVYGIRAGDARPPGSYRRRSASVIIKCMQGSGRADGCSCCGSA